MPRGHFDFNHKVNYKYNKNLKVVKSIYIINTKNKNIMLLKLGSEGEDVKKTPRKIRG